MRQKSVCVLALAVFLTAGLFAEAMATTFRLQNGSGGIGTMYSGCEDTYLRQNYPGVTPGRHDILSVGNDDAASSLGGGKNRALIRFDLTGFKSGWQTGTTITGARLKLFVQSNVGTAFTGQKLTLYRVSTANGDWHAGNAPLKSRSDSVQGAACWKWISFENTNFDPSDGANCPGGTDCPRRFPWAGDLTSWNTSKHMANVATIVGGCQVSGTDFNATPVGTATINSTDFSPSGAWVTITITDYSYFSTWINSLSENTGFLISCPGIETDNTSGSRSRLIIRSSDNLTVTNRPTLEVDVDGFVVANQINYSLNASGKVSASIFNSQGREIKQLLVGASRNAGANAEFWDCKSDSLNYSDKSAALPDGDYTLKIMNRPVWSIEYLQCLGITAEYYDGWPGNMAGNPFCITLDDENNVYVGGHTFWWSEGAGWGCKIKPDGTRLVTYDPYVNIAGTPALTYDINVIAGTIENGKYYIFGGAEHTNRDLFIFSNPNDARLGSNKSFDIISPQDAFTARNNYIANDADMALRNGVGVVSCLDKRMIKWFTVTTSDNVEYNAGDSVYLGETHMPFGVTLDNAGRALLVIDGEVKAYVRGQSTGTTVIAASLLDGPFRVDVNKTNGDIYVAEGGARHPTGNNFEGTEAIYPNGQQVKRFSSTGTLLHTYGIKGGRKLYGKYDPTVGFRLLTEITVAKDGSFWITEDGNWNAMTPPHRVSHIAVDGTIIKEFYGGMNYANNTFPEYDNPGVVWMYRWRPNTKSALIRCTVDYVNRTWKPTGVYNVFLPPVAPNTQIRHLMPYRHNGQTYFYSHPSIATLYFDTLRDTIVPVAFHGRQGDLYNESATLFRNSPEALAILTGLGLTPGWGIYTGMNWYDANYNGKAETAEWTIDNKTTRQFPAAPTGGNPANGELFNFYQKINPVWHSVGGTDIPQFSNVKPLNQYYTSVLTTLPVSDWDRPFLGKDSSQIIPGRSMWTFAKDPTGPIRYYAPNLLPPVVDKSGNMFNLYTGAIIMDDTSKYLGQPIADTSVPGGSYNARRWNDIKKYCYQNVLAKQDSNGTVLWSVGMRSAAGAVPNAGELSSIKGDGQITSHLQTMLGSAKGCLFASDVKGTVNYVWSDDGLWIGNMFENIHANSASLPAKTFELCGEQFGGYIYEVPNNNTPGLKQGDVLWYATGKNSTVVYKIHGLDQLQKITYRLTVTNGQISQTGISNQVNLLSKGMLSLSYAARSRAVHFTIPAKAPVTLELYTALGHKVATLTNSIMEAGSHAVVLDAKAVRANGFYILRLTSGSLRLTKQMMVVE